MIGLEIKGGIVRVDHDAPTPLPQTARYLTDLTLPNNHLRIIGGTLLNVGICLSELSKCNAATLTGMAQLCVLKTEGYSIQLVGRLSARAKAGAKVSAKLSKE